MTLASSAVIVDGFKLKNVSKWEGESPLILGCIVVKGHEFYPFPSPPQNSCLSKAS